jgi:hypothetical protein
VPDLFALGAGYLDHPEAVARVVLELGGEVFLAAVDTSAGDGDADSVVVNATAGDDEIDIRPARGRAVVSGLSARLAIASPEAADPAEPDTLTVNTLSG